MGGSAPSPPDPWQVSAAQTQSNVATAQTQSALNAVDQYNPFGGTTFLRDQNGDPYGQISELTPAMNWLLGNQEGIAGGLQGTAGNLIDHLPTGPINAPGVNDVGQAAFMQQMGMLQPMFNLQTQGMEQMLTDRGIPVGSETWNNAMQGLETPQMNAMLTAANAGQVAGAQEQNTLFGQAQAQQKLPYDELASVLQMNPAASMISSAPGMIPQSPTPVQPTNVSQNVYQSYNDQLARYQQQQQQLMGGLLGAGALGLAAFSSEKLKENFEDVDHHDILSKISDLPIKHYDYKKNAQTELGVPEHRTGPMAEDYHGLFGGDGHMIDLADLSGHMLAAIQALEERTRHLAK
jgi:hypothetical protein